MSRREDGFVEALTALCSDVREGGRRMFVMPAMGTETIIGLGRDYRLARAGNVFLLWREEMLGDGADFPDCGDRKASQT